MLKKRNTELWSPKEHNSAIRLAFESKFHRFWFGRAFRTLSWWEACPVVSLLNQALSQFHHFPQLYFNHRNDLHAQESHFQSGSHLCISESISSASASHTQTIHLCNGHQGSSGSQCDSCCLLSRLLVSLAVKVPNQYNSCSCHSSHHQQQIFGLHQQTQMGTGNTPNWCSLSHHTAGRAAPSCPEVGQVPPASQIHTRMCYWCIHLSWCCSVTA